MLGSMLNMLGLGAEAHDPTDKDIELVDDTRLRLNTDCHNLLTLTQALVEGPPPNNVVAAEFHQRAKGLRDEVQKLFSIPAKDPWDIQIIRLETGLREVCIPQVEALLTGGPADLPSVLLEKLSYCATASVGSRPSRYTVLRDRLFGIRSLQNRFHHQVLELRGKLFTRGYRV